MSVIGSSQARKEYYEKMAAEADALAAAASDRTAKQEYLGIAAGWRRLAIHTMGQNEEDAKGGNRK